MVNMLIVTLLILDIGVWRYTIKLLSVKKYLNILLYQSMDKTLKYTVVFNATDCDHKVVLKTLIKFVLQSQ